MVIKRRYQVSGDNPTEQGLKRQPNPEDGVLLAYVSGDNPTEQGLKHRLNIPLPEILILSQGIIQQNKD